MPSEARSSGPLVTGRYGLDRRDRVDPAPDEVLRRPFPFPFPLPPLPFPVDVPVPDAVFF
jgi:hypothetical protein